MDFKSLGLVKIKMIPFVAQFFSFLNVFNFKDCAYLTFDLLNWVKLFYQIRLSLFKVLLYHISGAWSWEVPENYSYPLVSSRESFKPTELGLNAYMMSWTAFILLEKLENFDCLVHILIFNESYFLVPFSLVN